MLCVDVVLRFHGCVIPSRIISQLIHSLLQTLEIVQFLTITNSAAVIFLICESWCMSTDFHRIDNHT